MNSVRKNGVSADGDHRRISLRIPCPSRFHEKSRGIAPSQTKRCHLLRPGAPRVNLPGPKFLAHGSQPLRSGQYAPAVQRIKLRKVSCRKLITLMKGWHWRQWCTVSLYNIHCITRRTGKVTEKIVELRLRIGSANCGRGRHITELIGRPAKC